MKENTHQTVFAEKEGSKRWFTKPAWDLMAPTFYGWTQLPEGAEKTPPEAKSAHHDIDVNNDEADEPIVKRRNKTR